MSPSKAEGGFFSPSTASGMETQTCGPVQRLLAGRRAAGSPSKLTEFLFCSSDI